jgi:hypothetical protein
VGRGQVRIVAELSVSWLVQVWAWGLATVEGALALEVVDATMDGGRLATTLLRWEAEGAPGVSPTVATAWVERVDVEGASEWRIVDGPPVRPRLWWSIDVRR